ncbi:MAG: biotin/lipoyl-containing protein, partial [Clostridium sp.]
LAFPDSAVDYFKGMMGQPEGGFPVDLQKIVLKGEEAITCRPGELLPSEDFDKIMEYLKETHGIEPTMEDALSYALYPKVFDEYLTCIKKNGDFSRMGSATFFHGLVEGETAEVEIAEGKVLLIKLLKMLKTDAEGNRLLVFEVDGYRREIKIKDRQSLTSIEQVAVQMADPDNKLDIGASIPGNVLKVLVKEGDEVSENQSLVVIEAMKMETNITSKVSGVVESVVVTEGNQVKSGELLIKLKEQ